MGGALDGSSVANLFNSISYGLNFDVKDFGVPANVPPIPPRPYCASSTSSPYSPTFPSSLTTYDKQPDQYRTTEIHALSEFILISEANTQDPNPANWTGGRISMGAITRTGSDSPPNNAPIVGRHSGYANVLFADGHVDAIEIAPGQGPSRDINMNTPLWTLPGN
jgi:prepilin-type processing-associated H-X9-DG protein